MKKDRNKYFVCLLCLFVLLHVFYHLVLHMKLPYIYSEYTIFYQRKMIDRFTNCFFGINYFLLGYLLCDGKRHCAYIERPRGKESRIWMGLAVLCQMGAFFVYAVMWLGYTSFIQVPALIPIDYVKSCIEFSFKPHNWGDEIPRINWDTLDKIYLVTAVMPYILFLIVHIVYLIVCWMGYITYAVKQWFRFEKLGSFHIRWGIWNCLYIFLIILSVFWVCDAQNFYEFLEERPVFHGLRDWIMNLPPLWK